MSFLTDALPVELAEDGSVDPLDEVASEAPSEALAVPEEEAENVSPNKRKELAKQAEMRAEHQAAARLTMLDLAKEMIEGAKEREALEKILAKEKAKSRKVQLELEASRAREKEVEEKMMDAKYEMYKHRFNHSMLNDGFLQTMMLWSREAMPTDMLGENPSRTLPPIKADAGQNGATSAEMGRVLPAGTLSRDLALAGPPLGSEGKEDAVGTAEDNDGQAAKPPRRPADSTETDGTRRRLRQQDTNTGRQLQGEHDNRSKGDGVTLLWIFRAWRALKDEARRHKEEAKPPEVIIEKDTGELDKMKEMYEKTLAEERSKIRALEKRVQGLLDEIEKWKLAVEQLEREKNELLKQMKPVTQEELGLEELQRKYEEALKELAEKNSQIEGMRKVIRELESRLMREREQSEHEISKLKSQIRELAAELQRQILFAKHLRDLALKAKRDAAMSISPEKFAQLISELEGMQHKLTTMGAEHDRESQQANVLKMKLDMNKRRLELERQFLPLVHKVRGPVGPKNPLFNKNMQALSAAAMVPDALGSPQEKLRMVHSQSAGFLDTRGAAGGSPAAGGGRSAAAAARQDGSRLGGRLAGSP